MTPSGDFVIVWSDSDRVRGQRYNAAGIAQKDNFVVDQGSPTGNFAPVIMYQSGGSDAESVAVGDFNGDGNPDLAVAVYDQAKVAVLLGDGAGSFGPTVTYGSGGSSPSYIATADFNGDGKLDIAVNNKDSASVGVLLGDGAGAFGPVSTCPISATYTLSLAVGDFNSDESPTWLSPPPNGKTPPSFLATVLEGSPSALHPTSATIRRQSRLTTSTPTGTLTWR